MAANKSQLSQDRYGYDIVVATTEASINTTMKKYLSGLKNTTTYLCWVKPNRTSGPQLISYEELLKKTNGADPFKIKHGDVVEKNPDIQHLATARFIAGVKITLGIPNNYAAKALATLPKVIELQRNATVTYRMMCADMRVVQLGYDVDGPLPWVSLAQSDKPNQTWGFVSNVNLLLSKDAPFGNLPPAVQDQVKNLSGSMFGVQQLLFDLNNAGLASVPTVEGLSPDSDAQLLLTKYFVSTYFDAVKKAGQPVLNYVVVPRTQQEATLKPTSLNFHIGPLVTEKDPTLKTLDYLCSINNKTLPPPTDFTWDWVTAADQTQAHGVIAINRKSFAEFIRDQLVKEAGQLCFVPNVRCYMDGLAVGYSCTPSFSSSDIRFDTEIPATGETLVKISYNAKNEDEAGLGGGMGAIVNECHYQATVVAKGNALEVESSYRAHLYVRNSQTRSEADKPNRIYRDRLELAVDGSGKIVVKKTSTNEDHSFENRADEFLNFWADVNSVFDTFKNITFSGYDFQGTQIETLQDFIFPGGQTFAFKGFHFSDNQDLICSITYADPKQFS